ncbi:MAG: peroxiredoxin [Bacteroidota bacterium]
MLKKGDQIPEITLKDQDNNKVNLQNFKGKPLVIFFYPKDNTYMCTAQACSFRDHFDEFLQFNAYIVGISKDSVTSHAKVINKRKLPFPLLSDPYGQALKAFKVSTYLFGFMSARCTFIIDKEGVVQHSFREDFKADYHIKKSIEILSGI